MTFRISRPTQAFVKPESAFSVDAFNSVNPTAAERMPAENIDLQLDREFLKRVAQTQKLGQVPGAIGSKAGTLKLMFPLQGLVTGNGNEAVADAAVGGVLETLLLASCLTRIQQRGQAADASQTGSTVAKIKLSSQVAYGGDTGAPFIAVKNAAGELEVRMIQARETNVVQTVAPDWSRIPPNSVPVWGADVYYPNPDASDVVPNSAPGTCTFIIFKDGVQYTCTGCRAAPPKLKVDARKRLMLEWEFQVDAWKDTTTYALAGEQVTIQPAMTFTDSPAYYGVESAADCPIAGFEFDPGVSLSPLGSGGGANGRAGWVPVEGEPKLKLKPYFSADYKADYGDGSIRQVLIQLGKVAGRTVALGFPYCQITKFPGEADLEGKLGHELELTPGRSITGGTWEPWYIAFL